MSVDFHQGFLNNKPMPKIFYVTHTLSTHYQEELRELLTPDLNLQAPVVFDVRELPEEDQNGARQLIEVFFRDHNLSLRFPYPVYAITKITAGDDPLIGLTTERELPRFFTKRSGKMNVKETHLAEKNSLIQREIKNSDYAHSLKAIGAYAKSHHKIYLGEQERFFYKEILESLEKENP